jgi:hypothetical protein
MYTDQTIGFHTLNKDYFENYLPEQNIAKGLAPGPTWRTSAYIPEEHPYGPDMQSYEPPDFSHVYNPKQFYDVNTPYVDSMIPQVPFMPDLVIKQQTLNNNEGLSLTMVLLLFIYLVSR